MGMETDGVYAPETAAVAKNAYDSLGSTAQIVVKETAHDTDLAPESFAVRITCEQKQPRHHPLLYQLLLDHHSHTQPSGSGRGGLLLLSLTFHQ